MFFLSDKCVGRFDFPWFLCLGSSSGAFYNGVLVSAIISAQAVSGPYTALRPKAVSLNPKPLSMVDMEGP